MCSEGQEKQRWCREGQTRKGFLERLHAGAAVVVVKRRGSGRHRCLTQGGSGDDKRKVLGTKKKKIRNYGWNRTNSSL
ncbi:hypothetical protein E2C01_035531 [Portunus trituberculatus]|uniref:Uncharacterized protein n=1 Tax=Portunus trituberculatus TaxID=210409 RepID=A0A5B7F3E5_PORTR|nr:hypothetical protein [Portunus trituberculatus]